LFYDTPSYTGFVLPVDKYFPAWLMEELHPLVRAGQRAVELLWGESCPLGTWDFSTNGVYWAGKAGIPAIGLGPGDEKVAHMTVENVPLDEVVRAAEWYALLPQVIAEEGEAGKGD